MLSDLRAWLLKLLGGAQQPSITQISSTGRNNDLVLVGSSPFGTPIDASASFLEVPAAPSAPGNRYLFRLCAFSVPPGLSARLVAVGQYLEIAAEVPEQDRGIFVVRREVLSPAWSFSDGNVACGITTRRNDDAPPFPPDPCQLPSTSPSLQGYSPALIYTPQPGPVPYVAPNGGGRFFGEPLEGLGLWRDRRFPWVGSGAPLDYAISGGTTVTYWASVKQTDPATRPRLTGDISNPGALLLEDQFLLQFPLARYRRIGGFMVIEVGPSDRPDTRAFPLGPEVMR